MYEDYYSNQSGNGMPVFAGTPHQRGHGLGSMLAGLFRTAVPMLKRGLSVFGRQALKTGLQVANDVADGQGWKDSARKHVPAGVRDGIRTFGNPLSGADQTGNGVSGPLRRSAKRKSQAKKKSKKIKTKSKKARRDIFA